MTEKEVELKIEVLELKISKLEEDLSSIKAKMVSKKPEFKRDVSNSPQYEEFKDAIEASLMNNKGGEFITAAQVADYIRKTHNVNISSVVCGRIMKKLFSTYKVFRNGRTLYNLSITDGSSYV